MTRSVRRQVLAAAIATAVMALGALGATPAPAQRVTPQAAWTLKLTQRVTLQEFLVHRQRPPVPGLDWGTDGCSAPWFARWLVRRAASDYGFTNACIRHDFCYRNSPVHRPTAWAGGFRLTCDNVFGIDMVAQCYIINAGQPPTAGAPPNSDAS